jgi:rhamnosyltransferase
MENVSVVLPTRNNENHIADLLDSIFSQSFEGEIEVLVMDSSDDRTPEIAEMYSQNHDVRIVRVEPEDYNYGGTRNLGASMTSGDVLVFISADVDVRDKNWLTKLVRNLEDPLVAGVFGRQIPKEDASPMEEFFIRCTYPDRGRVFWLKGSKKIADLFFSNTNSAIKREVWEKIPLPEMLKSEDQEWAKRALLADYKILYEPEAIVYHSHCYTLKEVFKEYFDSGATLPYVYSDDRVRPPSFFLRGVDYEVKQLKYFLERGYFKHIPYSLVYDSMKFLGYFLGTKYKYMPTWMRKALCKKSNHWDKYLDAVPVDAEGYKTGVLELTKRIIQ